MDGRAPFQLGTARAPRALFRALEEQKRGVRTFTDYRLHNAIYRPARAPVGTRVGARAPQIIRFLMLTHSLGGAGHFPVMPRKLRAGYPGAIYHAMNHGDRRELIFKDDGIASASSGRWAGLLPGPAGPVRLGFQRRVVHWRAFISLGEQVHACVLIPKDGPAGRQRLEQA